MDLHLFLAVCLLWLPWAGAAQLCNHCDCVLSEESEDSRGVTNVRPLCSEGKIKWMQPMGAVRLELHPGYSSEFKACFVLHSLNTRTQVSLERDPEDVEGEEAAFQLWAGLSPDDFLLPLATVQGQGKELCVKSNGKPVRLHIEAERTTNSTGVPRIMIHYDIERIASRLFHNPLEECRPCEPEELLKAYCSSDFVVIGSMADVMHDESRDVTEIKVHVSQIIQQRGEHFVRTRRDSPVLEGTLLAPRKCGIRHGEGNFLFTGRIRLGHPTLHCAPFLEEWREILRRAEDEGELECSR